MASKIPFFFIALSVAALYVIPVAIHRRRIALWHRVIAYMVFTLILFHGIDATLNPLGVQDMHWFVVTGAGILIPFLYTCRDEFFDRHSIPKVNGHARPPMSGVR